MRTRRMGTSGYLTIYFSLIFPILMSMVLVLLQGARTSAVKMKLECATDIAMNSVLAEYNRELLNQYDLLFVDTSYGTRKPAVSNTSARLQKYLSKNLESDKQSVLQRDFLGTSLNGSKIESYSLASDGGGQVFRRQISDYYAWTLEGVADELLGGGKNPVEGTEQLEKNAEDMRKSNEEAIQEALESGAGSAESTEEGEAEVEVELENPSDAVNATRTGGLLGLVLASTASISQNTVDTGVYLSHRSLKKGDGIPAEAAAISTGCSEVVFHKYLSEKLGNYRNELQKSRLKYQIEYLMVGTGSDWTNLESVAKKILGIREGINVAYIFTDGGKMAEAEAWAASMSAVILNPELLEPIKISLLLSWAYVESLQDLRILLDGYRVPAVKTAATWHTALSDILNIRRALKTIPSQSGLDYKDYLYGLLLTVNSRLKTERTMDIIEMDIRKTPGNAAFCMDACLDSFQAYVSVASHFGVEADIRRRYGYYFYR